jgi:hypothetical protein
MSFAICVSAVAANSTRLFAFRTERRDRSGDEDDTIHNFAIWEAVGRLEPAFARSNGRLQASEAIVYT